MTGRAADQTGRFMQAIAALSAAPDEISVLGRRLLMLPEHDEPALDAMLAEVSETVMRRVLLFRTSGDDVLKLDVMERRILSVSSAPHAIETTVHNVGRALTTADAALVLEILRAFVKDVDTVYVVSELPTPGQSTVFDGLTLADLDAAKFAQNAQSSLPAEVQQALDAAQTHATAILCCSQLDVVWRWGSDAGCSALVGTGVAHAPSGDVPDSLALWGQGTHGSQAVLLVQWQAFRILILLPNDAVDVQFAHWHALLFNLS